MIATTVFRAPARLTEGLCPSRDPRTSGSPSCAYNARRRGSNSFAHIVKLFHHACVMYCTVRTEPQGHRLRRRTPSTRKINPEEELYTVRTYCRSSTQHMMMSDSVIDRTSNTSKVFFPCYTYQVIKVFESTFNVNHVIFSHSVPPMENVSVAR